MVACQLDKVVPYARCDAQHGDENAALEEQALPMMNMQ